MRLDEYQEQQRTIAALAVEIARPGKEITQLKQHTAHREAGARQSARMVVVLPHSEQAGTITTAAAPLPAGVCDQASRLCHI